MIQGVILFPLFPQTKLLPAHIRLRHKNRRKRVFEDFRRFLSIEVKTCFFLANRHIPCGEFSRRRQCEA